MHVGIFLPTWVGDACMATPLVRSLRQGLPQGTQFTAIGAPMSLEVFRHTPWFDDEVVFRRQKGLLSASNRAWCRGLRERGLDAIVLLTNSFSSAWWSWISRVPRRIGYARDGRGWMLTDRLTVPRNGRRYSVIPAIDYYLEIARYLDCTIDDRRMELVVSDSERQAADRLWQRLDWSEDVRAVVINSTGSYGQSKLWPESHVRDLAIRLANELSVQVLLHCGPAEREAANRVALQCNDRRIQSMGVEEALPLGLSKAVLEKASVVVSTDSGPRHMAVALNKPVVSLFGSTMPGWTMTYNRPESRLYLGLPCQPCYERNCPLQHQNCMNQLTVDRVFQMVQRRLFVEPALGRNDSTPLPEVA